MLRCVTDARAATTAPLGLSHRIGPTGEAVVDLAGDLDILSAEVAVSYVRDVIDRHRGPVEVNLTALAFCDARGLAALLRMAGYAERKGCPFRLASPSQGLVKIMRITRLDRRFLTSRASAPGQTPLGELHLLTRDRRSLPARASDPIGRQASSELLALTFLRRSRNLAGSSRWGGCALDLMDPCCHRAGAGATTTM